MMYVIVSPVMWFAVNLCCANVCHTGISTSLENSKGEHDFMRLKDKVAIITGSAGGMGQSAAELFAREGASIVVTDIASDAGEETARKIRDMGGSAIFVTANVAKENDVKNMVGSAIDAFGHVDVLYNNAGIMPSDDGSVTDITGEIWDRVMDVNLKSAFLVSKYTIPYMTKQ